MNTDILRIGIWFNPSHISYGGPAQVLIGTMLGFLQAQDSIQIRLNEPGDMNWIVDTPEDFVAVDWGTRGLKRVIGPFLFSVEDVQITDPNTSLVWRFGSMYTTYVIPSMWFGKWIANGLPFYDASYKRPLAIWGAGVNTEWFQPTQMQKKHTYFIYFKSQNWSDLQTVHEYLFANYFRMHGPVIIYYFYSHEELRAAATGSEFCIFLDAAETQGLASLEIMACGCPLFVLDCEEFRAHGYVTKEATSVTCWDARCGMKSSVNRIAEDFPRFLASLDTYRPREFVEEQYSWKASAIKLLDILISTC